MIEKYKNVLICDDESIIRNVYKAIFEEQGWNVNLARNANEGLNKAIQMGESLDIIVSDQNMNGTKGTQLYRDLKKHGLKPYFLLISGESRPIDYSGNFAMKPINANEQIMFLAKNYQVSRGTCPKRSRERIKNNNALSKQPYKK